MKKNILLALALTASCLMSVPKTWADSKGYIDGGQNPTTYHGVIGAKYNNSGADGGSAVYGEAIDGSGYSRAGHFVNHSPNGTAVSGEATAFQSGETVGGYFSTFSPGGKGVIGYSISGTGYTYGGWFRDVSDTGTAVHGEAGATSDGVTYGGHFESASTKGIGVYGSARAKTGSTYGGHFVIYSSKGSAVAGRAQNNELGYSGRGGEFISDGKNGVGVYGLAKATSGAAGWGGFFISKSPSGIGVRGNADSPNGVSYGVYGKTSSPQGYGVYSEGNMKVEGTVSCTGDQKIEGNQIIGKNMLVKGNQTVRGTKSAVVKLKNGEGVTLYAVEASENWFEDFGSGKLKDGAAIVAIDPVYAETVNSEIDYHVFLTPRGECKGLYVTNQKGSSFEVRELKGGKSNIPFSYRIVAKRKGYEELRLAKVKEETLTAMVGTEGDGQKNEASGRLRKVK